MTGKRQERNYYFCTEYNDITEVEKGREMRRGGEVDEKGGGEGRIEIWGGYMVGWLVGGRGGEI
jgi:hypothetical protein